MMIRPKGDQLEISFTVSETESWDGFTNNLNSFLARETIGAMMSWHDVTHIE